MSFSIIILKYEKYSSLTMTVCFIITFSSYISSCFTAFNSNLMVECVKTCVKLNIRRRCFVYVPFLLCCVLSSFLCVFLPPSLPYDLYRPPHSHPSCPLLHTDSQSVGRRGQRGRLLSGGVWKTRCFFLFLFFFLFQRKDKIGEASLAMFHPFLLKWVPPS